jgi:hypothetical protein
MARQLRADIDRELDEWDRSARQLRRRVLTMPSETGEGEASYDQAARQPLRALAQELTESLPAIGRGMRLGPERLAAHLGRAGSPGGEGVGARPGDGRDSERVR